MCVCGTFVASNVEKAHPKRDDVPLGLVSYFCFDAAVKEQNLKANPHSKLQTFLGHLVHLRCTVVHLDSVSPSAVLT